MAYQAYRYPVFQPAMRIVSSISQAAQATVTTTFAHQYVSGDIVRIVIPPGFGMQQINQMIAPLTVTGSTTFTIPINTINFDPFSTPSQRPLNKQYAHVVPVGEINSNLYGAVQNVLPYQAS